MHESNFSTPISTTQIQINHPKAVITRCICDTWIPPDATKSKQQVALWKSMTLVASERVYKVSMHAKYEVSIFNSSKVVTKVKVIDR